MRKKDDKVGKKKKIATKTKRKKREREKKSSWIRKRGQILWRMRMRENKKLLN